MARIALAILVLISARPVEAGKYLSAISVAVGSTAGGKTPAPSPPSPSGECDNCNGTGKLGDGTVFVPCPVCGGDGIKAGGATKVVSKAAPPAVSKPLVVVKQPGPMWNQNGHSATVDHLVNAHGIDRSTASRMTQSQRDITHSNAHNAGRYSSSSSCPNGMCPSSSSSTYTPRGIFRRWR